MVQYSPKTRTGVYLSMKEEILRLIREGKSYSEIENILNCSKGTISYHANPAVKNKYRQRQTRNRRKWLTDLKMESGGKCKICGYDKCLDALDFHHLNPSIKDGGVNSMIRQAGIAKAKTEAEKCLLVCSNCHRELHSKLPKKLATPESIALS